MALRVEDLGYLDEEFVEAEEPQGFSKVPAGDYRATIFAARAGYADQEELIPQLEWEFVVSGGEYDGRHLFKRNQLKDKQAVGWLKKDLRSCGIEIDDPAFRLTTFLVDGTEMLLDLTIEITVKDRKYTNKQGEEKETQNVYINGMVSDYAVDTADQNTPASVEPTATPAPPAQRGSSARPAPAGTTSTRGGRPAPRPAAKPDNPFGE